MNLYTLVGNDHRPGVEARAFRWIAKQSEKQSESEAQSENEVELQFYEASSYALVIDTSQNIESCRKRRDIKTVGT